MHSTEDPAFEGLDWEGDVPRSRLHDDVYFSRHNGLQESRHVFLDHNDLAQRWALLPDRPGTRFCIGETGFGTGLNFLAAWELWRSYGFRHASLHFVSVEKYPLPREALGRAHSAWPALAALSGKLADALPLPCPGTHRRLFDDGRVVLTLLHGDALPVLEQLEAQVDAWFLDGFTPSRNPDLWSLPVFREMARLSHPETTFATFTSAGQVRRELQKAGFTVKKAPGFRHKREMCHGHFSVRSEPANALPVALSPWFCHARPEPLPQHVAIIGGGLAGCAAAWSMARRGLRVTLLEQAPTLASGASGNPVGLTFVRLSDNNSPQNRYYLTAYEHALGILRTIFTAAGIPEGQDWCLNGILRVFDEDPVDGNATASDAAEAAAFLAQDFARWLATPMSAAALSAIAGFRIDRPGLLQPGSGWLNPPTLCDALTRHPAISIITGTRITALRHSDTGWELCNDNGTSHLADAIVVANSLAASAIPGLEYLDLRPVRGQLTRVAPTTASAGLRHAINYSGYLTPTRDGYHTVGATFHPKRRDTEETQEDHRANLAALAHALPHFPGPELPLDTPLTGRVAFRTGTPDYLPYVGPLPDAATYAACYEDGLSKGQLKRVYPTGPVLPHVYASVGHGSRGITSSLLAGEILCHWMLGEPAPVDREVLHALHPARFLIRRFRRSRQAKH